MRVEGAGRGWCGGPKLCAAYRRMGGGHSPPGSRVPPNLVFHLPYIMYDTCHLQLPFAITIYHYCHHIYHYCHSHLMAFTICHHHLMHASTNTAAQPSHEIRPISPGQSPPGAAGKALPRPPAWQSPPVGPAHPVQRTSAADIPRGGDWRGHDQGTQNM